MFKARIGNSEASHGTLPCGSEPFVQKHLGKPAKIGGRQFSILFEMSPKMRNFRDFLGDHFARVESSRDLNLTMIILHFHVCVCVFFSMVDSPKKS